MTQDIIQKEAGRTYALRGLSETQAQILSKSLELFSRLSIGQLDMVLDLARLGDITNRDGQAAPAECLSEAEDLVNTAKFLLTGYHPNASKGIGGEHTPRANIAWEMHKAIRHRLAWDRSPEGGNGVYFYDPHSPKYSEEPNVILEHEPVAPAAADQLFDVSFDDMFFMDEDPSLCLSEEECTALTQRLKEKGLLTAPFVAVVDVHSSSDDGKEDGQHKCFVTVGLRTAATSYDAAEDAETPDALLAAVVLDVNAEIDGAREGNWDVVGVEAAS